jgi:hypothetical protein
MIEKESLKCAPGVNYSEGSCFTLDQLVRIANKFNKKYGANINTSQPKKELLRALIKNIKEKKNCEGDSCLLELNVYDNEDKDIINTLRPKGPRYSNKWLSNINIDDVMKQYQSKYKKFKYLGTVPSDFEDLKFLKIKDLRFRDLLKKNKHKIGMVINLDTSNGSGTHWVSLYANLKKRQLYFFDSYGKKPMKSIFKFMNRIYNEFTNRNLDYNDINTNKKFKVRYNMIQHQRKNSECGVYSMNFIIRLLNGEKFSDITKNITDDDNMFECRKSYFR